MSGPGTRERLNVQNKRLRYSLLGTGGLAVVVAASLGVSYAAGGEKDYCKDKCPPPRTVTETNTVTAPPTTVTAPPVTETQTVTAPPTTVTAPPTVRVVYRTRYRIRYRVRIVEKPCTVPRKKHVPVTGEKR